MSATPSARKGADNETPRRGRGRPWSFDRDAALEKAMIVFWRQGYEATSVSDLTAALGIAPPSLYGAFGDKKRLFLAAVQHYLDQSGGGGVSIIRSAPTARQAVLDLLQGAAHGYTRPGLPPGCLLVSGAMNLPADADDVRETMVTLRSAVEKELRRKLQAAIRSGELPSDTNAAALAAFFMSVSHGMSLGAQDGATRAMLLAVAEQAMRAWPAAAKRRKKKD